MMMAKGGFGCCLFAGWFGWFGLVSDGMHMYYSFKVLKYSTPGTTSINPSKYVVINL
jgi:hypothetical protein